MVLNGIQIAGRMTEWYTGIDTFNASKSEDAFYSVDCSVWLFSGLVNQAEL